MTPDRNVVKLQDKEPPDKPPPNVFTPADVGAFFAHPFSLQASLPPASPLQEPGAAVGTVSLAKASIAEQLHHDGNVITLPPVAGTGSGSSFRPYSAMMVTLTVGPLELKERRNSLYDTGAALSLCDYDLAVRCTTLPIRPANVLVSGIGQTEVTAYATLTVHLEGFKDGRRTLIKVDHDFHLVKNLSPGIVLGCDFIDGHKLKPDFERNIATFPCGATIRLIKFKEEADKLVWCAEPAITEKTQHLYVKQATTLAPEQSCFVACRLSRPTKKCDYATYPAAFVDKRTDAAFVVQRSLFSSSFPVIMVTNVGTTDVTLPSNLRMTSADVLTEEPLKTDGFFVTTTVPLAAVPSPLPEDVIAATATSEETKPPTATPFDARDDHHYHHPKAETDGAAEKVDGHFNVGIDPETGKPYQAIVDVLRRYVQAFSLDGTPGHVKDYPGMKIPLSAPEKLAAEAPRHVSPAKRAIIDSSIDQLKKWGVIRDSKSSTSYPVHLVPQNKGYRFCVDYRGLNAITLSDRYPLQRIDDVFEAIGGSTLFSALDAVKGYHQLNIAEEDRWKTAFTSHRGLHEYCRIPFGLKGAPAFFQRFMDTLLGRLRWLEAMVYLDDIVVYSSNLAQHVSALETLLQAAEKAGLRFDPKKCHFGLKSLKLLGRRICADGISVLEDKVKAIKQLSRPLTYHHLHSLLGFFTYYSMFIPRFAERIAPLWSLLKGGKYKKTGKNGPSVLELEDGTTGNPRTLLLPWQKEHQLTLDEFKDIMDKLVTLAHANYNKPFLAYIDACQGAYACAVHQQYLVPVDPTTAAPVAIRLPDTAKEELARLREEQAQDPLWASIVSDLKAGSPKQGYALVEDILVKVGGDLICLPKAALARNLHAAHDGHPGFTRTYMKISSQFWRPRLAEETRNFVKFCAECIRTKTKPRTGEMDVDDVVAIPFWGISLDLMLGFPKTSSGLNACLLVVCNFTKAQLLRPVKSNISASEIVDILEDAIVRKG